MSTADQRLKVVSWGAAAGSYFDEARLGVKAKAVRTNPTEI
jgi:hypothetical protein